MAWLFKVLQIGGGLKYTTPSRLECNGWLVQTNDTTHFQEPWTRNLKYACSNNNGHWRLCSAYYGIWLSRCSIPPVGTVQVNPLAVEDTNEYEYIRSFGTNATPARLPGRHSWPSSSGAEQGHRSSLPAVPEEFALTDCPAYSLTTRTDQDRSQLLGSIDSSGYVRTT